MSVKLLPHQEEVLDKLGSGSILCGGVGSGKSLTSLFYFLKKERLCDLYVITTARKRDTLEWEKECAKVSLSVHKEISYKNIGVKVDSWNNIGKYEDVEDCFFIFDEQRLVGSGSWVKSFLKISKKNRWILLSATPGDRWVDYIPVFVANGFYKNRTEFLNRHVVFDRVAKYPKIDRYIETDRLERLRQQILVTMDYDSKHSKKYFSVYCDYDKKKYLEVAKNRWDPFKNEPIKDAVGYCACLRKIVNSDFSKNEKLFDIYKEHKKIIVFYNFDYELEMLKSFCKEKRITFAEWNGHEHQLIPDSSQWLYLVQYAAGSEGWNCIETDTIIFYSLSYSYRIMEQSSGRIDRLNSPFDNLYYFCFYTDSGIDEAILKALSSKRTFNENAFFGCAKKTTPLIEEKKKCGRSKKESSFQSSLIEEIKDTFEDSITLKNDPNYIQGFPDLIILFKDKWAALECKRDEKAKHRPNQDYYVDKLNRMSYASFISPENKEEVIHELRKTFEPGRETRVSRSE